MESRHARLAKGCARLFKRNFEGSPSFGDLNDLDVEMRSLINQANIPRDELAVLAYVREKGDWALLTTGRLRWAHAGAQEEILLDDISIVVSKDLDQAGSKDRGTLVIYNQQQLRREVRLEDGYPVMGFWNLIKHLKKEH